MCMAVRGCAFSLSPVAGLRSRMSLSNNSILRPTRKYFASQSWLSHLNQDPANACFLQLGWSEPATGPRPPPSRKDYYFSSTSTMLQLQCAGIYHRTDLACLLQLSRRKVRGRTCIERVLTEDTGRCRLLHAPFFRFDSSGDWPFDGSDVPECLREQSQR